MALKKVAGNAVGSPGALSAEEVAYREEFPLTHEYLTSAAYEDGSPRERSMLLVVYDNGTFKACMQDRDQGRSLWVSGKSPRLAMHALEDALDDPGADWRAMTGGKQSSRRK